MNWAAAGTITPVFLIDQLICLNVRRMKDSLARLAVR